MIHGYTDGACKTQTGNGGWAYILLLPTGTIEKSAFVKGTTSNRMELQAVIELLRDQPSGPITVVTDSQYVLTGITKWIHGWKAGGWLNASGKPVLNKDLWLELDSLYSQSRVTFQWIKGHSGDPHNTRVDKLAGQASRNQIRRQDSHSPAGPGVRHHG